MSVFVVYPVKYFYYSEQGEKKGAFSGKEIKALAKEGLINPDTVIETEEGKQYHAHGIGGIEFGSVSTETQKSAESNQDSSIVIPENNKAFAIKPLTIPQSINEIDERRFPGTFISGIESCIGLANFVFGVIFALCGAALLVSILLFASGNIFVGVSIMVAAVWAKLVTLLSWRITVIFLKFVRATFCHQYVFERYLKKQMEILQHGNDEHFDSD